MQNLKIRVNNEAESREAQELFFKLGYEKGACSVGFYPAVIVAMPFGRYKTTPYSSRATSMDNEDHKYFKEITLPELRAMANQDQDEPFLTPECTLNDQYKEEPDLNFGAAQASGGVDATLAERQSQYGCYEDVAHVTQQILSALRIGNYDELPAPMKESLHMIASKMARIVNGDPEYIDNWHDIGGYAKLIEKLIKGE